MSSDSDRACQVRRASWRRPAHPHTRWRIRRPADGVIALLGELSDGRIDAAAARDLIGTACADASIEIHIDGHTGRLQRWAIRHGAKRAAKPKQ